MLSLNRCNGSFNTLDNPSCRIYVPNKTEDVNLYVHKHYFFVVWLTDERLLVLVKLLL